MTAIVILMVRSSCRSDGFCGHSRREMFPVASLDGFRLCRPACVTHIHNLNLAPSNPVVPTSGSGRMQVCRRTSPTNPRFPAQHHGPGLGRWTLDRLPDHTRLNHPRRPRPMNFLWGVGEGVSFDGRLVIEQKRDGGRETSGNPMNPQLSQHCLNWKIFQFAGHPGSNGAAGFRPVPSLSAVERRRAASEAH